MDLVATAGDAPHDLLARTRQFGSGEMVGLGMAAPALETGVRSARIR